MELHSKKNSHDLQLRFRSHFGFFQMDPDLHQFVWKWNQPSHGTILKYIWLLHTLSEL